jgi:LacI family transcriptional regulator
MNNPKPPTMKAVASLAGVSIQTVSAVVNVKPGITPETRARVQEAIQALGYHPYSVARSLRTGQTHTLALMVPDIANPAFSTLASAVEDYAHSSSYSVIVYNTHDDTRREASYVQAITQRWIDGVLFVSTGDHTSGLEALQIAGIPVVAIDRIPETYHGAWVGLDNLRAGQMAVDHLLDLGHTRLAHIGGPAHLQLARERELGFRRAVEAHGLAPVMVVSTQSWACESGYRVMRQILAGGQRPTGVFAASDRVAIGAMLAVHEAGLNVPADISIVGLDDIEVAAFQNPPLTTIRQSFARLGTLAVEILLATLEGRPLEQKQIMLEPTLVARASTARPPTNVS